MKLTIILNFNLDQKARENVENSEKFTAKTRSA